MSRPIYTDDGAEYPELTQPQGAYVRQAEEEFSGERVTWPEVHARAWALQEQDEGE